jgi:MraZ protein
VATFFGRYEHTIDGKGRVILPAKFRASFEQGGYLTQHHDGCLALWTPEQFDSQMLRMQERANSNRNQRNQARYWASTSHESEIDRQGRMMIPARLRAYADLEGDILVLGAIDRIELWNPRLWEQKVGPEEQRLTEGADD